VRAGVRLGIDVGSVRVGVARSDPSGVLATPVATLSRDEAHGTDIARIAQLVAEWGVIEVVVGLPRGLSGHEGDAALAARKYAVVIARRVRPVSVRVVDERLSTVTAQRSLREAGVKVTDVAAYTGSPESFREVVEGCFVPVLIAGGEMMGTDEEILEMVKGAVAAGAAGVSIGRNVFQHKSPTEIVRAISRIVHGSSN